MFRQWLLGLAGLGLLGLPGDALAQAADPSSEQAPIAVVVHPSSPLSDITLEDLRRLFLGSTTSLENGERVELLGMAPNRTRFYRAALGMSEDRLKRHWISRVFAGQAGTPPQEFRNEEDLLDFVASHPGAVAFIDVRAVTGDVKLVRVDGRTPADDGYAIR